MPRRLGVSPFLALLGGLGDSPSIHMKHVDEWTCDRPRIPAAPTCRHRFRGQGAWNGKMIGARCRSRVSAQYFVRQAMRPLRGVRKHSETT